MDNSNQKKNPVYSNTDTSKVAMADEEWKKYCRPISTMWQDKGNRKALDKCL